MKGFLRNGFIFLAAWLGTISLVQAGTMIYNIRYGVHSDFDRIVFELSAPINCHIETVDSSRFRIHLGHVEVSPTFRVATLPEKTVSVLSARASGGGKDPFVVNVKVRKGANASLLSLGGKPSRIAVDIKPAQAALPPKKEEPEYIPGDRPIPTKFAEGTPPFEGIDEAKIHAILAYYFAAIGDSVRALQAANAYTAVTGKLLNLTPETVPTKTPPMLAPSSPTILFDWFKIDYLIAFLAGMIGYAFSTLLSILIGWWTRRHPRDQVEDLMARAQRIRKVYDKAAEHEAQSPEPPSAEETPQEVPAPELSEVQTVKDSTMERRVQQVVELSKKGKTVADIAQELEMSQDEIKLILDLNQ